MTTPLQEAINDLQFMKYKATDAFSDIVWGMAITILRDVHIEKEKQFWDAAREDEAVGFAEWVEGSAYRRKLNGMWYDSISGSANSKLYSTDELYQLYLKHKNEKK